MNTKLVKCTVYDLELLVSISRQTYRQHYSYLWKDQGMDYINQQFNQKTLHQQLLDPNCDYFKVSFRNKTVGFLKLNYFSGVSDYPPETCLEIQRIYLLSDYVGMGLGSELFRHTEAIAQKKNLTTLWLMAMDSSKAKLFYQKHGYKVIGKTSFDHPYIKREFSGMYLMIKLI